MKKKTPALTLPEERLFSKIYVIRGHKVMLDADLAELYGVETKILKRAVRRNMDRFPKDFMFELTVEEWRSLRSRIVSLNVSDNLRRQFGTSNKRSRGGTRYLSFAFTEQGVAMLSGVLNSKRAAAVNIQIMRIFVRMRRMITGYKALLKKIEKLEATQTDHNKHISNIYQIIKELLEPKIKQRRPIGFIIEKE